MHETKLLLLKQTLRSISIFHEFLSTLRLHDIERYAIVVQSHNNYWNNITLLFYSYCIETLVLIKSALTVIIGKGKVHKQRAHSIFIGKIASSVNKAKISHWVKLPQKQEGKVTQSQLFSNNQLKGDFNT